MTFLDHDNKAHPPASLHTCWRHSVGPAHRIDKTQSTLFELSGCLVEALWIPEGGGADLNDRTHRTGVSPISTGPYKCFRLRLATTCRIMSCSKFTIEGWLRRTMLLCDMNSQLDTFGFGVFAFRNYLWLFYSSRLVGWGAWFLAKSSPRWYLC